MLREMEVIETNQSIEVIEIEDESSSKREEILKV
jgi:hypothetical protein